MIKRRRRRRARRRRPRLLLLLQALFTSFSSAITIMAGVAAAAAFSTSSNASPPTAKTALVTGSTDGIGLTTAKNLCSKGYNVLIHGRDLTRINNARDAVLKFVKQKQQGKRSSSGFCGTVYTLPPYDLSTVDGSVNLANEVQTLCDNQNLDLTVLMNNAGVYSERYVTTQDGLELTFAVNVLAPFVITSLLLPTLLEKNKPNKRSRIVIASSISQCRSIRNNWDDVTTWTNRQYSAHGSYSESKLLDAMLTVEMSSRLMEAGLAPKRITCNCLDPGTVNTKMLLAGWGPCGIDVNNALDQTWLCSTDEVETSTGKYYVGRTYRKASLDAYDIKERNKLWSLLSNLAPDAASMWDNL